jgi:activating signal cointegrator 1
MSLIRTLTVKQPWASLITAGVKTIETRSWSTKYRGPLAIHAGLAQFAPTSVSVLVASMPDDAVELLRAQLTVDKTDPTNWWDYHVGAVVAVVDLVDVLPVKEVDSETFTAQSPYGHWSDEMFAWVLESVEPVAPPVKVKGRQGLWSWDSSQF